MTKVPFSQEGLNIKRKMLKELPPEEQLLQLDLIQKRTREWCAENFVFNEDQQAYLQQVPALQLDEIGMIARLAIQFDQDIVLETPAEYVSPLSAARPRKIKTKFKGGGSYNPGTGSYYFKLEGSFTIILY